MQTVVVPSVVMQTVVVQAAETEGMVRRWNHNIVEGRSRRRASSVCMCTPFRPLHTHMRKLRLRPQMRSLWNFHS